MDNNIFLNINVFHYLILGGILFLLGFIGMIISKNLIRILISFGIMMNAVFIIFAAIGKYLDAAKTDGTAFSIFLMIICLANISIIISIIINIFAHKKTMDVEKLENLKG